MLHDDNDTEINKNAPVPVETGLRRIEDSDDIMILPDGDLPAKPAQPLAAQSGESAPGERRRVRQIDDGEFDDDTLGGGYATVKGKQKSEMRFVWIVLIIMTVMCCAVGVCSSVLTGYFMRRGEQPVKIDPTVKYEAIAAVIETRKPCVVEVESGSLRGSGVITKFEKKKIFILTNYHVIENGSPAVRFMGDDTFYYADVLGYDEYYDVAVITVDSSTAPYEVITLDGSEYFSRTAKYREGDLVVAIGNAMGYGIASYDGIISRASELIDYNSKSIPVMRTTAAINAGMSGGALFDMTGRFIGLNTYRMTSSSADPNASHEDDVEDTGFVVPVAIVYPLYKQILEYGDGGSIHGSLVGMTFTNNKIMSGSKTSIGSVRIYIPDFGGFTAEYRKGKLTVTTLDDGTPARGLKVGDVIKSIGAESPVAITDNICDMCGEMLRYRKNAISGSTLAFNLNREPSVRVENYYRFVS